MGRRAWIIASSEFVSHRVQLGGVYATASPRSVRPSRGPPGARLGRSARAGSSTWLAAPFHHQERKPTVDLSKRDCAETGFPRRKPGSAGRLRGLSCSMAARNAAGCLRCEDGSVALTGALRSRCSLPKEVAGAPKPLARPRCRRGLRVAPERLPARSSALARSAYPQRASSRNSVCS